MMSDAVHPKLDSKLDPRLDPELDRALRSAFVIGWDGPTVDDDLKRWLDGGLGGVILHSRNVVDADQLRSVTDELRSRQPEVLVAVDQEGGRIGHLARAATPPTPGAWALGALDDPGVTAAVATELAAHLVTLGVTVSYSPVADVQADPRNPIIRTRAFGSDPALVARHVEAWVRGTQTAGVAATVKHFPGHGSTSLDSHLDAARDGRDLDTLRRIDLTPFRATIDAGVALVMTTHVLFDAIDPMPATLSHALSTELLRDELGFDGVLVSDALEMAAIADTVGIEAGAVLALAAGNDQICIARPDPRLHDAVLAKLHRAVGDGRLAESRVLEAAGRVRTLARAFPAQHPGARHGAADGAGRLAARESIRATHDGRTVGPDALVIDVFTPPKAVLEWDGATLASLVASAAARGSGDGHTLELTTGLDAAREAELVRALDAAPQVILATQDADIHPWQRHVTEIVEARRPDAWRVETGLPSGRPVTLATFGRGVANLEAAAAILTGH